MTHLSMGMRKAAVFPEPVWAHDMISRPAWMIGTAHFWTFSRFFTRENQIKASNVNMI